MATNEVTDLHVGQYVRWWVRKKGGHPERRHGRIEALSSDGQFARVRLEEEHPIPVQTIETKRLSKSF